jgi:hypothetical protein
LGNSIQTAAQSKTHMRSTSSAAGEKPDLRHPGGLHVRSLQRHQDWQAETAGAELGGRPQIAQASVGGRRLAFFLPAAQKRGFRTIMEAA